MQKPGFSAAEIFFGGVGGRGGCLIFSESPWKSQCFFKWEVANFCVKWQFVVNETEIVQHSLKMLYVSLLPKYTK
jgi:hypothetical protein